MAEALESRPIRGCISFALIILALMFLRLLPLDTIPATIPPPDLMMIVTFTCLLRRPTYAPVLLIAALFLLADFLLNGPPGLWAALIVAGSEFLRPRATNLRAGSVMSEWLSVAVVIAAVFIGHRIALTALMVPRPAFGFETIQMLLTIACYPIIAFGATALIGLSRDVPGAVDRHGRRL